MAAAFPIIFERVEIVKIRFHNSKRPGVEASLL